ncbi:MAG: tRNA (adenosine(37)-N6)-threonylcarbamoyltransferase complex ATPase subunit type 1 TsaE [Mariprofundus sp.]|nr:tRNA (adenosine(37)-N6)-threonylcarbamoyltransferase complex ATPase subunit type 1 TsaE [Mariprofundus sp.]
MEHEGNVCQVAHMDWYRLEDVEEIELLGVRDYFQPTWICLIEWPQRAPMLLPEGAISVELSCVDDDVNARIVEIAD